MCGTVGVKLQKSHREMLMHIVESVAKFLAVLEQAIVREIPEVQVVEDPRTSVEDHTSC